MTHEQTKIIDASKNSDPNSIFNSSLSKQKKKETRDSIKTEKKFKYNNGK